MFPVLQYSTLPVIYGLKRAPNHWFDTFTSMPKYIDLKPFTNAPCIFSGSIIHSKPHLYVDVYVDDLLVFSTDDLVERHFQT